MSAATHIILAVLVGLGVYFFKDARHDAAVAKLQKDHATAVTKAVEEARADEQRYRKGVENALAQAQKRLVSERAAADRARLERDGLRHELAASRDKIPDATRDSLNQYAATLSGLFDQCAASYSDLARQAQGHASDVRTLTDAWPKNPP